MLHRLGQTLRVLDGKSVHKTPYNTYLKIRSQINFRIEVIEYMEFNGDRKPQKV